jgi:hypothetical protein
MNKILIFGVTITFFICNEARSNRINDSIIVNLLSQNNILKDSCSFLLYSLDHLNSALVVINDCDRKTFIEVYISYNKKQESFYIRHRKDYSTYYDDLLYYNLFFNQKPWLGNITLSSEFYTENKLDSISYLPHGFSRYVFYENIENQKFSAELPHTINKHPLGLQYNFLMRKFLLLFYEF